VIILNIGLFADYVSYEITYGKPFVSASYCMDVIALH